jgi:serine/threonine-protein kinase
MSTRWTLLPSSDPSDSDPFLEDDSFLQPPPPESVAETMARGISATRVGTRVGPYRLVELIASGGMGDVYLARRADDAFTLDVAVKILRRHLATPRLLRRFHFERQTLAQLRHPNITSLLDGGTTEDGLPYLVMEHVQGRPIDAYCDEQRLPLAERLELFREVCAAVACAHRNLVVHRDLKPSNILVTDGGEVKLLDFGIAGLLDDGRPRAPGETITVPTGLTPHYASPEQVQGGAVTTATDVYSLGVVLYELLTGVRPYEMEGRPRYETDRMICEVEPTRPSTAAVDDRPSGAAIARAAVRAETPARLRRRLVGDLDTIVGTALRKDAIRRYSSVEQMSDDVGRHLRAQPLRARPDSFAYRTTKFVARNRPQVIAAAVALVALVGAVIGTTFGLVRAQQQEQAALAAQADTQGVLDFFEGLLVSANPFRRGQNVTVTELLEEAEGMIGTELAGRPEVEAGARLAIARMETNMMRWRRAEPHLERALILLRQTRSPQDPVLAECLSMLGRARTHLKRPGAIEAQREGLAIRVACYGAEHPLVAESTGNLGFALWSSGPPDGADWAGGERHYLRALAMLDRLGQHETHDTARITLSLGFMYMHQGRLEEAEARYRAALALYERLPEQEDRYEFATLGCYAQLLEQCGRYAEAAELRQRYCDRLPRGVSDGQHRIALWQLGQLRARLGEHDRAIAAYHESLAILCELAADTDGAPRARLVGAAARLREGDAGAAAVRDAVDLLAERPGAWRAIRGSMAEMGATYTALGDDEMARWLSERAESSSGHGDSA